MWTASYGTPGHFSFAPAPSVIHSARVQSGRSKLARVAWLPVLLGLLGYLFADGAARWQESERVTRARAAEAPAPALESTSPTGYAFGQRKRVLAPWSVDGCQWIMQAQRVVTEGGLRVRFVDWDNAPTGREAHWSSGLVWWLAGLGWIDHILTGRPLALAVEHAAPLALPILLAAFLVALTPLLAGRFGALAAAVVGIGLVLSLPIAPTFVVGYVDHHGVIVVFSALGVLLLASGGGGWVRDARIPLEGFSESTRAIAHWLPDRRSARFWFVGAAFAGAAALWMSAASEVPVLVGIGLGALATARGMRRTGHPWKPEPTLWRLWGVAGAFASMFFYILETFPALWSPRLEVNHPLYALAWLGAGDVLCRAGSPRNAQSRFQTFLGFAPGLLALAALPATIFIARSRSFVLGDPFLWAIHTDYIQEFQPLLSHLGQTPVSTLLAAGAFPSAALIGAMVLLVGPLARPGKSLIILTLMPLLVGIALALKQERWLVLACALSLATLAVVSLVSVRFCEPSRRKNRTLLGMTAIVLLATSQIVFWPPAFLKTPVGISAAYSPQLTARSLAFTLRQRLGSEVGVIVGGPTITSEMIYFGGFRGLGTNYWENRDGLRAAVEILGAATDEDAFAAIRKHGITHIVDASWDFFSTPSVRLLHGLLPNETPPAPGFLNRLENGAFPSWVRPILAVSERNTAMVYEVDPNQTPLAALTHNARFFRELGQPARAQMFLERALAIDSNYAPALIALASLQATQPDSLKSTLPRLRKSLSQQPSLEVGDQIDLAVVWRAADDEIAARYAAAAALAVGTEKNLRRLSATQLRQLLDLAEKWNLPFAPGIPVNFASSLLPKALRTNGR